MLLTNWVQNFSTRFATRLFSLFILAISLLGSQFDLLQAGAESYFPPKTLVSLTGQPRSFFKPGDPKSQKNKYVFIALGFDPKRQAELERGVTFASQVKVSHPNLDVIEIAVLPPKYESSRGIIQNFMKANVQNKQYLPHVYALFDDVNTLKASVGLSAANNMIFLLCNAKGEIVWKSPEKPKPEWKALWVSKITTI